MVTSAKHHDFHLLDHHVLPKQVKGFLEGGIAAVVAGVSTHPLDLIKVRMQLVGEGAATATAPQAAAAAAKSLHGAPQVPFAATPAVTPKPGPISVTAQIIKTQGVAGLFSGVSATALRQVLYSASRMGVYEMMKTALEEREKKILIAKGETVGEHVHVPALNKVAAALAAGGIGAAIGNPAELAMVRMQADGRLPVDMRRNYKGVGDALARIVKEEGVLSLWRGCGPTIYRAMAVTAGQLAAYDQAKEFIHDRHLMKDGMASHVTAAFTAAIVASVVSNPFDVIKTRLMNMNVDPATGKAPYSGALDCAIKSVTAEGPLALYKGLLPTIARQGPFALILFLTLEQVRVLFKDL